MRSALPGAAESIEAELAPDRDAKDALRFPYAQEQPDELLARVAASLAER